MTTTAFTSTPIENVSPATFEIHQREANDTSPRERYTSPRPRTPIRWLIAATLVVAVVAARPWNAWSSSEPSSHPTPATATAKVVNVTSPSQATASNVVLPATFRPWQTATLYARVSGYLTKWHHDLGESVKAGELLAEIETPELDQELAEAQAQAHEAEAAAVQASAERLESQADLQVAEAQLVRAEAEVALAKSQLVRREQLLAKQVITREEYDTFYKDVEARTADVAAVKSDVVRRRTNLDTRAATIKAREATAKSRRANVERLKELQAFKRIVAPFDGVIARRNAEVGMLVTPGKEPLFTIEDMSRVRVQLNVPQTYAAKTVPGAKVVVSVPESSSAPVTASITRVADSVDAASRTMLAEIVLDNQSHHFQPGSYAQVTLATEQAAHIWTIPTNTLSMRVDGPHVAVVNNHDQVEIKPVSLGRDLGKRIVVVEGIRGDERLVVNPSDSLSSGLRVQVNQRNESAAGIASMSHQDSRPHGNGPG